MTFKEAYAPPFKISMNGMYAQSSNHTNAFTALTDKAQVHLSRIVRLLNGDIKEKYDKKDITVKDKTKIIIDMKYGKQKEIILVRGWGKLVGRSENAFGLDPEEAAKIQDDFVQWVVDSITEEKEEGIGCVVYGPPFPTA